jgi:Uma2 family endonuclease
VVFAPLPVRLREGKYREPEIVFMLEEHNDRIDEDYRERADLVIEVVSEDDPDRDLILKRREYAGAGIPEYWIVDRHLKDLRYSIGVQQSLLDDS